MCAAILYHFDTAPIGSLPAATLRAARKAAGDAARAMRAEANRAVRAKKRLKARRVRLALPLFYPKGKDLEWRIPVSSEPVPVGELGPRQTKKGVTFGINKSKRSLIKHAFIATLKSGHVGVFTRRGKSRLPIDEAFTTRVSDVFHDSGQVDQVYRRAQSVFLTAFARLLPLETSKARFRASGQEGPRLR